MDKKIITIVVNGTRFELTTELIYEDNKVPLIHKQNNQTWKYEAKIQGRQGRK